MYRKIFSCKLNRWLPAIRKQIKWHMSLKYEHFLFGQDKTVCNIIMCLWQKRQTEDSCELLWLKLMRYFPHGGRVWVWLCAVPRSVGHTQVPSPQARKCTSFSQKTSDFHNFLVNCPFVARSKTYLYTQKYIAHSFALSKEKAFLF